MVRRSFTLSSSSISRRSLILSTSDDRLVDAGVSEILNETKTSIVTLGERKKDVLEQIKRTKEMIKNKDDEYNAYLRQQSEEMKTRKEKYEMEMKECEGTLEEAEGKLKKINTEAKEMAKAWNELCEDKEDDEKKKEEGRPSKDSFPWNVHLEEEEKKRERKKSRSDA